MKAFLYTSNRHVTRAAYPEDLVEKLQADDDDYQEESDEVEPSDRVLRSAKRQK